jgi:type III restriction enzyme
VQKSLTNRLRDRPGCGGTDAVALPDFLIWTSRTVICLDTKGSHLIGSTVGRKLFFIRPKPGAQRSLDVQFVSKGKWNNNLAQDGPGGHTRRRLNNQGILRARHFDNLDTLITELTAERDA